MSLIHAALLPPVSVQPISQTAMGCDDRSASWVRAVPNTCWNVCQPLGPNGFVPRLYPSTPSQFT